MIAYGGSPKYITLFNNWFCKREYRVAYPNKMYMCARMRTIYKNQSQRHLPETKKRRKVNIINLNSYILLLKSNAKKN